MSRGGAVKHKPSNPASGWHPRHRVSCHHSFGSPQVLRGKVLIRYDAHYAPGPEILLHFPMQIQPPADMSSTSGNVRPTKYFPKCWYNGKKLRMHHHLMCAVFRCVCGLFFFLLFSHCIYKFRITTSFNMLLHFYQSHMMSCQPY